MHDIGSSGSIAFTHVILREDTDGATIMTRKQNDSSLSNIYNELKQIAQTHQRH